MNILKPASISSCLLLLSVGFWLSYSTPAQGKSDAKLPKWLAEMMARETPEPGSTTIKVLDDALQARMLAKLTAEPTTTEWGTYFEPDIGADVQVSCYAYDESHDTADLLQQFSDVSIEQLLEGNAATLSNKLIEVMTVGHVERFPYFLVQWFLVFESDKGRLVGQVKVAVALMDDFSLACTHSDTGYQETFTNMFLSILETAQIAESAHAPDYRELLMTKLEDVPIGFLRSVYATDDEGDTSVTITDSDAYALNSNTLATSDSWSREWSRPDGSLINATSIEGENGEIKQNLAIQLNEEGNWAVEGTLQGKQFVAEIPGDSGILTIPAQNHAIKSVITDAEIRSAELPLWLPTANPGAVTTASFRQVDDAENTGTGILTLGPVEFRAEFGDDGLMRHGTIDLRGRVMTLDRVWYEGAVRALDN